MDTNQPRPPVSSDDLMRYMDGELPPEERDRVEAELKTSTELQRELAIFKSLKSDIQGLQFHPASRRVSVWDHVNARLNRPIGWFLFLSGLATWLAYGTYVFATSSASPWEKLGTGAVAIGILMLLASVIWERMRDWESDPYKDIQR